MDHVAAATAYAARYRHVVARLMRPPRARWRACVDRAAAVLRAERRDVLASLDFAYDASGAVAGARWTLSPGASEAPLAEAVWEAVAPEAWLGDDARAFRAAGVDDRAAPWTVAAALALASDPEGVMAAESLAREGVARLAPWGVPPPRRVVWYVEPRAVLDSLQDDNVWRNEGDDALHAPLREACAAVFDSDQYAKVWSDVGTALFVAMGGTAQWFRVAGLDERESRGYASLCSAKAVEGAYWWRAAAEGGRRFRAYSWAWKRDPALAGRPVAEVADPFAPFIELYARGYGFARARDGVVVLVAEAP